MNELVRLNNNMNEQEQNLFAYLVTHIETTGTDKALLTFKVPKKDVLNALKLGSNNYEYLADVCDSILKKTLYINRSEDGKSFSGGHVLTGINWNKDESDIEVFFNVQFKHLLLDLREKYVSYNLDDFISLEGRYSKRIYELMKSYRDEDIFRNNRNTGYQFDYHDFRELIGVPKDKYPRWWDFSTKVLQKSIDEIKEKTDLLLMSTPIKKGRKVVGIQIYASTNVMKGRTYFEQEITTTPTRLTYKFLAWSEWVLDPLEPKEETYKISKMLNEFAQRFDDDKLLHELKYTSEKIKEIVPSRKPKNIVAYLKKALALNLQYVDNVNAKQQDIFGGEIDVAELESEEEKNEV
jgi:plasmid replication initiation protein